MSGNWLSFQARLEKEKAVEFTGIFSKTGANWVSSQGFKPSSKEVLQVIERMESSELLDNDNDMRRNLPGPLLDGCYYGFSRIRGNTTAYGQLLQSSSVESHSRGSKSIIVHLTRQTCVMVTYESSSSNHQKVQDKVAEVAKMMETFGF